MKEFTELQKDSAQKAEKMSLLAKNASKGHFGR